ncbi:MAG: 2-oxoglutarate dehydrogenase complex dihydrolipoyllysine-residue succinyltransferase [Pirellulaceae bacterium]|nr:2-oxoglutarate dehydrogenase complex dihydrolipoyllysine-residue succinyltransferase [Pirellulaceae bacterium]
MLQIKVPTVGESISEVQIGQWLVAEGGWVAKDQTVVDLETEKAAVQVPAPQSGYVRNIRKQAEEFASVGDVLCDLEPAAAPPASTTPPTSGTPAKSASPASAVAAGNGGGKVDAQPTSQQRVMPAAQRILSESGIPAGNVPGTGPGGRVLKEDALAAVTASAAGTVPRAGGTLQAPVPAASGAPSNSTGLTQGSTQRVEEIRPMSMIRRTIASRLVEAQQTAALLTTFNEVNMQPIMDLRNRYRDAFQQRHGVKLGFMSFFAKASVEALRRFPAVNSEIRGNNVVYRNYMDIGIAIGGGKGLVVPVLRNVELLSFAEVERTIGDFAAKAMENRLMPEDLTGGTFTISNGGVYGSMLSTPIVNPPQSAILGLHSIQERPMAVDGQVVIQPMMYLALTYDHRIIDGREAVTFLKTIKEICEDPTRLFLEV